MVLLHGFTDTWHCWSLVLPALEAHHRVFAPTLPGHYGGEQYPAGVKMTIPDSLDRIERLLDAHDIEKAHFVGSSLGGWASLELAVRGRALSVVGVCPAGGWYPGSREERASLRFFKRTERMLRRSSPQLLARIARNPRLRRVGLRDLMVDSSQVTAEQSLAMMMGSYGCAVTRDAIELAESGAAFGDLGPIDVPVRILYGTRDRLVTWPHHYTRMRQLLPDAEYVALENMGHLPMWEQPDLIARRILEVSAPAAA
jgi:pimeloyl-ACP methyl ester carboxylesterase